MRIINLDENSSTRFKSALFGDITGKIRTFAILTPENPMMQSSSAEENNKRTKQFKELLKQGSIQYIKIEGEYGNKERSYMLLNIPCSEASSIASRFQQQAFFWGKVNKDSNSIIEYWEVKDPNAKKLEYKLTERNDEIASSRDFIDYFSRHGNFKFRFDMDVFNESLKDIKPIQREEELEHSLNENTSSMNRYYSRVLSTKPREEIVNEATSRIYRQLTDDSDCAIISAYVDDESIEENKKSFTQLKADVRKAGYGYRTFVSRWVSDGVAFDEEALFIPKIDYKTAFRLSNKYNQKSFIYKNKNKCVEICTTPFETYKEGDVVRTYNISGNNTLNIEQAQQIFSRKLSGPASKPVKGSNSKPFNLQVENYELLERYDPKASYFEDKPHYDKIMLDENRSTRFKSALFGDVTGKIRTFAIMTPENPNGETVDAQLNNKLVKGFKSTLKTGYIQYIPIEGSYNVKEHSFMLINIPLSTATHLAGAYHQQSFFYGKTSKEGVAEINYYETSNAKDKKPTYSLKDKVKDIRSADEFDKYYSRHGDYRFKFNADVFNEHLEKIRPIIDEEEYTKSMMENRVGYSQLMHRLHSYKNKEK